MPRRVSELLSSLNRRRQKKEPPKTTGRGEGIMLRLHRPQIAALEERIARQNDKPSRPKAIRRLVERALAQAAAKRPPE